MGAPAPGARADGPARLGSAHLGCAPAPGARLFAILLSLLLLPLAAPAVLESAPASLEEFRWKTFVAPSSEIYIDTSLQFSPAELDLRNVNPKKDKLALWLNVEAGGGGTNLCVYASQAGLAAAPAGRKTGMVVLGARGAVADTRPTVFRLRTTRAIEPGRWYRLTVRTIADVTRRAACTGQAARALLGFQIYLDDTLLFAETPPFTKEYLSYATSSDGWLDAKKDAVLLDFLASGSVFASLCGESADMSVGSVGFRGDGECGDIDVSSDSPALLGVDSLDFTLDFTAAESAVRFALGE